MRNNSSLIDIISNIEKNIQKLSMSFSTSPADIDDLVGVGLEKVCSTYNIKKEDGIKNVYGYYTNIAKYAIYRYAKIEHRNHKNKFVSIENINDEIDLNVVDDIKNIQSEYIERKSDEGEITPEQKEQVEILLNKLPGVKKDVAIDWFINKLSYIEITKKYKISKQSISNILKFAISEAEKLR